MPTSLHRSQSLSLLQGARRRQQPPGSRQKRRAPSPGLREDRDVSYAHATQQGTVPPTKQHLGGPDNRSPRLTERQAGSGCPISGEVEDRTSLRQLVT